MSFSRRDFSHWDDNKVMERDPNLGNFSLRVGFSQNGGGSPDDGLSDARHSIRCLASYRGSSTNIALGSTETHHERIAMGIYDFFSGMSSSCT